MKSRGHSAGKKESIIMLFKFTNNYTILGAVDEIIEHCIISREANKGSNSVKIKLKSYNGLILMK